MPCIKVGNKWKLGSGKAIFKSKASCERAYAAYRAKKYSGESKHHSAVDGKFIDKRRNL